MSLPVSQSIVCPVLIGRAEQLAALGALIARVSPGGEGNERPAPIAVALIAGEAGIGKSRLMKEAAAVAAQRGITTLSGRCFEQDRAFPYAPWIDLLNSYCAEHPLEEIRRTLRPAAGDLVKIAPELAVYFPELSPEPALDPEQEKRRLFQTWLQWFRLVGAQPTSPGEAGQTAAAPLLVMIDDLHWCDDSSLDLLLFLARHASSQPLVLLGSYRSDESHEALEQFLAELDRLRILTEVQLARLSLGETENMLRAILSPSGPIGYDLLETLFNFTEGNPFFIEEALKSWAVSAELNQHAGALVSEMRVPRTLQVALQRRLEKLSPAARRLISLAAVIGRRFSVGLIKRLIEQPDTDLSQQLRELIHAQLAVEESADLYAFRHALTREAIYHQLLGHERKELHGAIAPALEQVYANQLDAHLNDLAYHCMEAGDWQKAYRYARLAGERALTFDATRAALVQFTRALEAADHAGIQPPPLDLRRARGHAYQTLGHLDEARADYQAVLQAAGRLHDRRTEWQSFLDLGFSWTSHDYHRAGEYFQQALIIARELDEPALLAQTLNRIGNWRYMSGQPFEGRELHVEALAIFQAIHDQREIAATLDLLGISSYGVGDLWDGGQYYQQAIALYRQMEDRQGLITCLCAHSSKGGCYFTMTAVPAAADLDEIIADAEEAVDISRQMGWRPDEAYALSFLAFALGPHGEFDRTLKAAQRSLAIAAEIEHPFMVITAQVALGALYLDLLDFEKARQYLEQADALALQAGATFVSGVSAGYLAQTYLALNQIDLADKLLRSRLPPEKNLTSESMRWVWTAQAELLLKQGRAEQAAGLIDEIIRSVPHTAEGGVVPRLWLVRGRIFQALGQPTAAEQMLGEALAAAQDSHLPTATWPLLIALGQTLQAARRTSAAQEQWSAARAEIDRLAANISHSSAREQFLERATAMIPTGLAPPRQARRPENHGLTAREMGVARQIAQGKSNQEIAGELVLSRRTIEVHVANIMSKLGVRSRSQIAAWVVENGHSGKARKQGEWNDPAKN